jgi:hypothetical protein
MATARKIKEPVVLFASVERKQHDALRALSFKTHRSIADLTRDALKKYIAKEDKH